jgi:hypothetical protein
LAFSLGLAANFPDDHAMLEHGMMMYDSLRLVPIAAGRNPRLESGAWPMSAAPEQVPTTAVAPRRPIREIVLYFLRLGTIGFGGPVALVGQMEKELSAIEAG